MKIHIPLTIQKICPRWTKKIRMRETMDELTEPCIIDGKRLNIGVYESCVVGEALNLFDKYYDEFIVECHINSIPSDDIDVLFHNDCEKCSSSSVNIFNSVYRGSPRTLEASLKEFSDHLEKDHKDLIK